VLNHPENDWYDLLSGYFRISSSGFWKQAFRDVPPAFITRDFSPLLICSWRGFRPFGSICAKLALSELFTALLERATKDLVSPEDVA
jgi:hypothetical protein